MIHRGVVDLPEFRDLADPHQGGRGTERTRDSSPWRRSRIRLHLRNGRMPDLPPHVADLKSQAWRGDGSADRRHAAILSRSCTKATKSR
jgi:hypothetical protein